MLEPEARPENLRGWAEGMREALLSPEYRPMLVEAGHDPHIAEWCLRLGGNLHALQAWSARRFQ